MSKRNNLLYQIERIANPGDHTGKLVLSVRGKHGKRTLYKSVPFESLNGEDIKIEVDSKETADVFLRLRGGDTSGSIPPSQMALTKTWVSTKRIGK